MPSSISIEFYILMGIVRSKTRSSTLE